MIDVARLIAFEAALERSGPDEAAEQVVAEAKVFEAYLNSGPWVLDGIDDPELRRALALHGWRI